MADIDFDKWAPPVRDADSLADEVAAVVVDDGFFAIDGDDAERAFAQLKRRQASVWRQVKHEVRQTVKRETDLKVQAADDWAGRVEERAAREAADDQEDTPTFEVGSDVEISRRLEREVTSEVPLVYDFGQFHRYDRDTGIWRAVPEHELSSVAQEYDGAQVFKDPTNPTTLKLSKSRIDSVVGLYADRINESAADADDEGFFDGAPKGLMFDNVFLRVADDEFVADEPSPDHRARTGATVPYDPDAEAPMFDEYLDSIFEGDPDAEQKRQLLVEFAGAALFGLAPSFERVLVLYDATESSAGSNGKSVFIKILSRAFPRSATSQVSPQKFDERFAVTALAGARVNYVTELPESDIIASDKLKGVITGDPMMGEEKYGDPFWFRPKAGHIFAANELPRVQATDDAFWRRWMVLPFSNRFTPEGEPGRDRVRDLDEKIVDQELEGVMARMVEGVRRLLDQGGYTVPSGAEAAKRKWRRESNPIEQFLVDETKNYTQQGPTYDTDGRWWLDDDRHETATDLYEAYRSWASATGHHSCSSTTFGQRVKKLVEKKRPAKGTVYRVRLKPKRSRFGGDRDENFDF